MTTLLCLHGWGGSKESFVELRAALQDDAIEILTPDLPGFGAEPEPTKPWGIDDYAEWVEKWFRKNAPLPMGERTGLSLLGHSLGGQIAVKIALRGNLLIHHLFLAAPAAIRPRFSLRRTTGYIIAKCGRTLLMVPSMTRLQPLLRTTLYRLMRVHDYERASPIMQRTMLRVTHEDLTNELPHITVPTDIFWGIDDRTTPLQKGLLMQKLIPSSSLHTYPSTRHAVHRNRAKEIATVIKARIGIS